MNTANRPAIVREMHLVYLDKIRKSGATNMYGAGPYLERKFFLSSDEAHEILAYWMNTFSERHAKSEGR